MPDTKDDLLRPRPTDSLILLLTGICGGVVTGAVMNAINGWISPSYFRQVLWLSDDESAWSLWLNSIEHGVIEGLFFGVGVSIVLTAVMGLISNFCCPLRLAFSVQVRVILLCLFFWCLGGVDAVVLARFLPRFYTYFRPLPVGGSGILEFAWVEGSILGIYIGAVVSTLRALLSFKRKWRQLEKDAQI